MTGSAGRASVARSAASLLASRLAVAAIALAFLGVSTRLLSLQEMAVFALYNTFCGLFTVVGSLGLLASCVQAAPGLLAGGRRAEAAVLLRTAAIVYLLGSAAVAAALFVAAAPIARLILKTGDGAASARGAALAGLCFGLYEATQLLLSALQRFRRLGGTNVAAALIQRVLSLGLWLAFGMHGYLAGFAAGSLAGAAMNAAVIGPFLRPGAGERTAARRAAQPGPRAWIGYSMPFYIDGYLRHLYMHADQILVGIFLSPVHLSVYFVAKRFIQYGQVLVSSLVDPLSARAAELRGTRPDRLARTFGASWRYFVLLFVPMSALLAGSSPFLLLLVGGAPYEQGSLPLALLFVSLPLYALFSHLSAFVFVLGRPADRLRANLVSAASQTAAAALLMPALGLAGLALARVGGFGTAMLYCRRRALALLPEAPPDRGLQAVAGAVPVGLLVLVVTGAPALVWGRPLLTPASAVAAACASLLLYFRLILEAPERAALGRILRRGRSGAPPGAGPTGWVPP